MSEETKGIPMPDKKKENPYLVAFAAPYTFENTEYTSIDLSGLEQIKGSQIKEAQRLYAMQGSYSSVPETDVVYCLAVAAIVTGKPSEFFDELPAKEVVKVRSKVCAFFLSEA